MNPLLHTDYAEDTCLHASYAPPTPFSSTAEMEEAAGSLLSMPSPEKKRSL